MQSDVSPGFPIHLSYECCMNESRLVYTEDVKWKNEKITRFNEVGTQINKLI